MILLDTSETHAVMKEKRQNEQSKDNVLRTFNQTFIHCFAVSANLKSSLTEQMLRVAGDEPSLLSGQEAFTVCMDIQHFIRCENELQFEFGTIPCGD